MICPPSSKLKIKFVGLVIDEDNQSGFQNKELLDKMR